MPDYNFQESNKKHKLVPYVSGQRCIAIVDDGTQCTIIVKNFVDEQLLCHIHHPDMKFQQNQAKLLRNNR